MRSPFESRIGHFLNRLPFPIAVIGALIYGAYGIVKGLIWHWLLRRPVVFPPDYVPDPKMRKYYDKAGVEWPPRPRKR